MSFYNDEYINTDGNLIHRTAIVGENVSLGKGNVIMPYAVIGEMGFIRGEENKRGSIKIGDNNRIGCHTCIMSGKDGMTQIGSNNLVMNHVNIGHNVCIDNDCEIGAGVIIGGHALIEKGVKIKIGATIRNRMLIGQSSTIGMGAVVVRNVPDNAIVFGNPAKPSI